LAALRDVTEIETPIGLAVEGTIPDDLRGTLLRNGPGRFSQFGEAYNHWFDGDGVVTAVRITGDGVTGVVRRVRTARLDHEEKRGRRQFGLYGTAAPSLLSRLGGGAARNPANTSVFAHGDRLYALCEAGLPVALNPATLASIGDDDIEQVIVERMSAHPHRVEARAASYGFGQRWGRESALDIYVFPDGGPASRLTTVPMSAYRPIHDFVATDEALVFFVPPVFVNQPRLLLGIGSFSENLDWRPELGTEVIIIPIARPDEVCRFRVDAFFQWHFANAFGDDDGLMVDFIRYPDFSTNEFLRQIPHMRPTVPVGSEYVRAMIDVSGERVRFESLYREVCEFPAISPNYVGRPHRYVTMAADRGKALRDWFGRLIRLDLKNGNTVDYSLSEMQYPSEATIVPRGEGELDAWVLSLVYDAVEDRSFVGIWDAAAPAAGTVGRIWLPGHIPYPFHGIWRPDAAPTTGSA
jgi:all-trans-8'-apo-beta-carotenal 15,15'-oxygenase